MYRFLLFAYKITQYSKLLSLHLFPLGVLVCPAILNILYTGEYGGNSALHLINCDCYNYLIYQY